MLDNETKKTKQKTKNKNQNAKRRCKLYLGCRRLLVETFLFPKTPSKSRSITNRRLSSTAKCIVVLAVNS